MLALTSVLYPKCTNLLLASSPSEWHPSCAVLLQKVSLAPLFPSAGFQDTAVSCFSSYLDETTHS